MVKTYEAPVATLHKVAPEAERSAGLDSKRDWRAFCNGNISVCL